MKITRKNKTNKNNRLYTTSQFAVYKANRYLITLFNNQRKRTYKKVQNKVTNAIDQGQTRSTKDERDPTTTNAIDHDPSPRPRIDEALNNHW